MTSHPGVHVQVNVYLNLPILAPLMSAFCFSVHPLPRQTLLFNRLVSYVTVIVTTTREPREITCLKCGGPAQSDCDIRSYSISDTETCMSGCVTINQLRNESMYTISNNEFYQKSVYKELSALQCAVFVGIPLIPIVFTA